MRLRATCTLLGPEAGVADSPLFVLTSCGDHHDSGDDPAQPPPWGLALGSRASFEQAVLDALRRGGGYPTVVGETMLRSLGWAGGQALVHGLQPTALRLALTDLTCRLLPEMTPVPSIGGQGGWLDTVLPVFRTLPVPALDDVDRPRASSRAGPSVAIVYQAEPTRVFEALADKVRLALPPTLVVDEYPGRDLAAEARRVTIMDDVFFRHRAVLFLGHLRPPSIGIPGGWMLTEDEALPITDIRTFLGARLLRAQAARRVAAAPPVPELVVCGCCCGAWGDPGARGPTDLFYPAEFLHAGVRFFVGSWTDVRLREAAGPPTENPDLDTLAGLFGGFLTRWSADPGRAIAQLHEAKKALGFPLLASLFQLYTVVEPRTADAVAVPDVPEAVAGDVPAPPGGALVDRLGPGTVLGAYRLGPRAWSDTYAVTFWAESPSGRHLVQVLADDWQDEAGLTHDLGDAVRHLQRLGLGERHLVPDRVEALPLADVGGGALRLVALIYDRPPDEAAEAWVSLRERPVQRDDNDHYRRVLELGAEAACRLWELHEQGIAHGNFDAGCLVVRPRGSGTEAAPAVYVKDAWVHRVRPGRPADPRYAAPDEPAPDPGAAPLERDCWGLGVVLHELATGRLPDERASIREAAGSHADRVPEALDRVVRECLMPVAAFRPSAEVVARRLLLAVTLGGTYVEDLEAEFDLAIRAGRRLFVVRVDDLADIERILAGLQAHPRAEVRYHLYVASEDEGVLDRRTNRTVLPWMHTAEVHREMSWRAGATADWPNPPTVAVRNGRALLEWISGLDAPPPGEMPVLLVRGLDWWVGDDLDHAVSAWRVLKHTQREVGYPVIVLADSVIRPLGEVSPMFVVLDFPPPSPSELFERLLGASRSVPSAPALAPEAVALIGGRLFPCASRELEELFRLCTLRYGRIDERIVELRDEERARRFGGGGVMRYVPFRMLPPLDHVGWPPALADEVPRWLAAMREDGVGQRRALIVGRGGYGKSFAAQAVAGALGVPLIRFQGSRCLRPELGASEAWLSVALRDVNAIGGAVVLLDAVDSLMPGEGESATTLTATLSRLVSILRDWIETIPPWVVVVLTATGEAALPPSWRRLVERRLVMDLPALDGVHGDALTYREAVFRALFRKFRLAPLAADDRLVARLARETHPALRGRPLPAAAARRRPAGALGRMDVELRDGSQIEDWMATTILYHTPLGEPGRPARPTFWEEAVE